MDIKVVTMYAGTLTNKFQVEIPRVFCDDIGLKAGQQFVIMIPRREMNEVRGMFKDANTKKMHNRSKRTLHPALA